MPKSELIQKMEEVSERYADVVTIQTEMDVFTPDDHYERTVRVPAFPGKDPQWEKAIDHEDADAAEQMAELYDRTKCPIEPKKPNPVKRPENVQDATEALKKKLGCLPIIAGFIGVCSLISGGLFAGDAGTVIGNLVILIACVAAAMFYFKKQKAAQQADEAATKQQLQQYEEDKQKAEAKYEQAMNTYLTERSAYLSSKEAFLAEYAAWREVYLAHVKEEEEIGEKLEADRLAGVKKIREEKLVPAQKALEESNDLIGEGYLPVLHILLDFLKSGRADDLKEAVNLYEEMVYRERQLQLQREQEEQRRREEEQRRRDEERRHREEMKFREDQERQRRYEEDQRRRDEDRRAREDAHAREAEARHREYEEKERIRKEQYREHMDRIEQERKQRNAGQAQCRACAHAGRCNMMIHNSAPTCTGFTPRR